VAFDSGTGCGRASVCLSFELDGAGYCFSVRIFLYWEVARVEQHGQFEQKPPFAQIWPSVKPRNWRAALISAESLLRLGPLVVVPFAPRTWTLSPVCLGACSERLLLLQAPIAPAQPPVAQLDCPSLCPIILFSLSSAPITVRELHGTPQLLNLRFFPVPKLST
jgi:hypothetical protein